MVEGLCSRAKTVLPAIWQIDALALLNLWALPNLGSKPNGGQIFGVLPNFGKTTWDFKPNNPYILYYYYVRLYRTPNYIIPNPLDFSLFPI